MKHLDKKTLWGLVSQELKQSEVATAQAHLEDCRECQSEFEIISLIHTQSYHIEREQPSMRLSKSVVERLEKETALDKSTEYWIKFTKFAIVGAVLFAVATSFTAIFTFNIIVPEEMEYLSNVANGLIFLSVILWMFYLLDKFLFRYYNQKRPDTQ